MPTPIYILYLEPFLGTAPASFPEASESDGGNGIEPSVEGAIISEPESG